MQTLKNYQIREGRRLEYPGMKALYASAFPDEDLWPLVKELDSLEQQAFSLFALFEEEVVGHVAFTHCNLPNHEGTLSMLAPLAVAPEHQRKGVGTALINEGLKILKGENISAVLVLGDPAYYGRMGFEHERGIRPPYPIPAEYQAAWQSIYFDQGFSHTSGELMLPAAWMKPELWSP